MISKVIRALLPTLIKSENTIGGVLVMQKSGIYCIENRVNGKRYIGQTQDIDRRKHEHIKELKGNYHYNDYLQKAFNKYGESNFKFYIIERCDIDKLNEREKFYIEKYGTMNKHKGYNLRAGGHEPKLSESSKRKISETRKKRIKEGKIIPVRHKWTDEQRERLSKAQLKSYKNNPELKERLSEARATICIEKVKRIKMLLYMDMDINEIADITGVGINIISHLDQGTTFQHILPKLNYYIKNRYVINKQRQISKVLKEYREGLTYSQIASNNNIHIRTAIRIVQSHKTQFDEHMRDKAISYELNKKYNMVRRMYKNGWTTVKISKHYKMSRNTISKILNGE